MQTEEAQLVARFIKLGEQYPVTFPIPHPIRLTLIEDGIASQAVLFQAREYFSKLHNDAMAKLETIGFSDQSYEGFDCCLQDLQLLGCELRQAEDAMTDQSIQKIVDQGDAAAVRESFVIKQDLAQDILRRATIIGEAVIPGEKSVLPMVEANNALGELETLKRKASNKKVGNVSDLSKAHSGFTDMDEQSMAEFRDDVDNLEVIRPTVKKEKARDGDDWFGPKGNLVEGSNSYMELLAANTKIPRSKDGKLI